MSSRKAIATFVMLLSISINSHAQKHAIDSAWRDGQMVIDTAGVISRSNIVLGRPNKDAIDALPLGNGRLGAAVWSEDGFTAQLNRSDTMPYRYSTGQVKIPGIAAMTAAQNYAGHLDLYDGSFKERGGGMTLNAYVQPHSDTLIIDVTGADPAKSQTATLELWEPRKAKTSVHGQTAMLSETWIDDKNPGYSGRAFGSLSAIAAEGRNVSAAASGPHGVALTFTPEPDGHFRIIVASPHFESETATPSSSAIDKALSDRDPTIHLKWWNAFWRHADPIKVTSSDGTGEYMENLRNIYLFSSAAENGGEFPGSQAGVGDLFSSARDEHRWDPSAFWHWNLRMQVAANLGAGIPQENDPYFRLYRDNLSSIEKWTRAHMKDAPGICVPETMRFNGVGIEFETSDGNTDKISGLNCDAASTPYYNARTLSTGAEVSLWIWQQYQATGDKAFLAQNYPVMAASARFLLSYEKQGGDGLLHTEPSNAHETQWDVVDPITDLSARNTLDSATIAAATALNVDSDLITRLRSELTKIPPFPRVAISAPTVLLPEGINAQGQDMLTNSYRPQAEIHNIENLGLEPLWPYALIGDTSPQFELERRTYVNRPNKANIDWSFDPVDAARLHMGDEVRSTLLEITRTHQGDINGFAKFDSESREFYVEQIAIVALALQESLVQDYDGIIRIAPAVAHGWDFDGKVAVRNGTTVAVQTRNGVPTTVGIEVTKTQPLTIRDPWPGEPVDVRNASTGSVIATSSAAGDLSFQALGGTTYQVTHRAGQAQYTFKPVDGKAAAAAKKLGKVQIGLEAPSR